MKPLTFYDKIIKIFREYDVDDLYIKTVKGEPTLILIIDEEDDVPEYKIYINLRDEDYLSIHSRFKRNSTSVKDFKDLCIMANRFNFESFLKFTITQKYVVVSYNIPDVSEDSPEQVVKTLCLMPSLIAEFYVEMQGYLYGEE